MSPKRVEGGAAEATVHLQKADEFLQDARDALGSGRFDAAVSAAAVAGVNASDAVTLARAGLRSTSGDHSDALALLHESGDEGAVLAASLGTLLTYKNPAQCQGRLFRQHEASEAVDVAAAMVGQAHRAVVPEARPARREEKGAIGIGRFLQRLRSQLGATKRPVSSPPRTPSFRQRCGARMPRAGVHCVLRAGHKGPHRSR